MRSVYRELPFEAEITLLALVRMPRDDWYEEDAGFDLLANRLVPDVAASERALVKPDLDARSPQRLAKFLERPRHPVRHNSGIRRVTAPSPAGPPLTVTGGLLIASVGGSLA